MDNTKRKNFILAYIYIIAITFLVIALSYISIKIPILPMMITFIFVIAAICFVWKRKLSKFILYVNNVLLLLATNIIAYILVNYVIKSLDSLNGIVVSVSVIDVISFTKLGKHTLNAKLMNNTNSLARLSVCLPLPKVPGLLPIIGAGDLQYYSMITMYYIKTAGNMAGLYAALILVIGQLINIIAILILKKIQKERYKGFPATLFPGMFIFIANIFGLI